MIDDVIYFVVERENIRRKKAGDAVTLTTDPILRDFRFCNVRRKDDRVSQWLLRHYYPSFAGSIDDWFAAIIARYINWPPTLQVLLDAGAVPVDSNKFNGSLFIRTLAKLKSRNEKIFTGAYMIYPGRTDEGITDKAVFIATKVLEPLMGSVNLRAAAASREVFHFTSALAAKFGFSPFMAGQVSADLTYFSDLQHARDIYTYAPMGPGSKRGLNRLHLRKLSAEFDQPRFNRELMQVHEAIEKYAGLSDLTLHDVQNVMCEMDKYWRVKFGEGRPRSFYRPETAYEV